MLIPIRMKGVTLIELLIVIIIAIILTVGAISSFTFFSQNYRLQSAGELLFFKLQEARTQAMKLNTTIYVSFTPGTSWCYGINSGSACNCATPSSCNIGATTASGTLLSLSTTGFTGNAFTFDSLHGGTGVSGNVIFTSTQGNTNAINVKVSTSGSLQVCSAQLGGYSAC